MFSTVQKIAEHVDENFLEVTLKNRKRNNNAFYLNQYIKNIIISTCVNAHVSSAQLPPVLAASN